LEVTQPNQAKENTMKKLFLTLIACVFALFLTGCAGMGGNDAYAAAHKSYADTRTAESNNRAKAESDRALAAASMAKQCKEDVCRALGFMAIMQMGGSAQAAVATPAPVIAPPVNEAVEIFKDITKTAVGLYGIRVNGALGLVNATRGAADIDAAKAGIGALDIYTTTTTSK
jgi:PBP1b-binding outer membrane lipoprotein LpoB